MAKKEPTIEDTVNLFFDVINRCGFQVFRRYNRIVYSRSKKNTGTFFILDQTLWNNVSEDQDFNEITRERDPLIKSDRKIIDNIYIFNEMESGWITIPDDDMITDKRIYIKLDGNEYNIEINKTIWPIRFRKAENNNFSYQVFRSNKTNLFAVRKKFISPIEDASFYMVRVFQII